MSDKVPVPHKKDEIGFFQEGEDEMIHRRGFLKSSLGLAMFGAGSGQLVAAGRGDQPRFPPATIEQAGVRAHSGQLSSTQIAGVAERLVGGPKGNASLYPRENLGPFQVRCDEEIGPGDPQRSQRAFLEGTRSLVPPNLVPHEFAKHDAAGQI